MEENLNGIRSRLENGLNTIHNFRFTYDEHLGHLGMIDKDF